VTGRQSPCEPDLSDRMCHRGSKAEEAVDIEEMLTSVVRAGPCRAAKLDERLAAETKPSAGDARSGKPQGRAEGQRRSGSAEPMTAILMERNELCTSQQAHEGIAGFGDGTG